MKKNSENLYEIALKISGDSTLLEHYFSNKSIYGMLLEDINDADVEKLRTAVKTSLEATENNIKISTAAGLPALADYFTKIKNALKKGDELASKLDLADPEGVMGKLKGLNRNQCIESSRSWFKNLEVSNWWNKNIEDLSKGMSQKVQFISTVLHDPDLIILDEPFSGFDPVNANLVKSNLLRLKEEGKTIIFSTHRMESVDELCDHLAMINNSKKILDGDTEKIKMKYKSDNYLVTHDKKLKKDSCFSIVKSEEISEGIFDSEVSLSNNKTYKQLFKSISDQSKVISFKEKIPSMNDIFIMKVKEGGSDE